MSEKKRRGRPPGSKNFSPKPYSSTKAEKITFNEIHFWNWMAECATIVLPGWELRTVENKNWYEIVRFNPDEERMMPFAFVDKKNGNIHCPALMHGDPHEYVRGNISDTKTRLAEITPYGVLAGWPWQPTHPDYKAIDKIDLSAIHNV